VVYAAPALILLIAAGAGPAFDWLRSWGSWTRVALTALLLAPAALSAYHVAVPWGRADCAGASAHVLARLRDSDTVTGNTWEYEYYFRHCSAYQPGDARTTSQRLWLVASSGAPPEREGLAQTVAAQGWHTIERRDFERTTVFLMERLRTAGGPR
jgi:hypothetical protein